jgi:metallo-beta-lactamase class B
MLFQRHKFSRYILITYCPKIDTSDRNAVYKKVMKNTIAGFILGILQLTCYSQSEPDTINLSDEIKVIKISDNAFIHLTFANVEEYGRVGANGLILINKKEAFLFDTPWTDNQTEVLCTWITEAKGLKIKGFIPNHWHDDCMGGLRFIQRQKIETYANQMTIEKAESEGLPTPSHGFKDSLKLMLGDKEIDCFYLGAAHSMDNIVIWIPSEKILFAGCMVKSFDSKNLGNTSDGDLNSYRGTLDKLLDKFPNARLVIPGHGNSGGVELIRHTGQLVNSTR